MANTAYASLNTRPHWAGTNADLDIHLEAYEGEIEGSFRVESMFRGMGLTNYKSVANASNTYRGDRVGGATVKGRQSGTALDNQRIPNEKYLVTVDTVSYVRSTLDLQDEWTAPDFQAEYSAEHGTAHAKAFDQAHLIQLIKCGAWVAPTSLKNSGAFFDGISKTLTGYTAETNMSATADYIVKYHNDTLADFVNRDLSGTRVVETPRFPTGAISGHFLGPQFDVSAAEAKAGLVVFHPKKTLVTVEAKPMVVDFWEDKKEFSNVLDSYTMYTVGIRRGDATAVLFAD